MFDYNVFPSLSYFTWSHYIDLTRSTLLKEDRREVVDEEKAELMWMVGKKDSQRWFKEADGLREGQLPLECSCQYDKALLIALRISSLARSFKFALFSSNYLYNIGNSKKNPFKGRIFNVIIILFFFSYIMKIYLGPGM